MQPSTPYVLAALERANDDRRRALAMRHDAARTTSAHERQRRRVLESLFRIPTPEQR